MTKKNIKLTLIILSITFILLSGFTYISFINNYSNENIKRYFIDNFLNNQSSYFYSEKKYFNEYNVEIVDDKCSRNQCILFILYKGNTNEFNVLRRVSIVNNNFFKPIWLIKNVQKISASNLKTNDVIIYIKQDQIENENFVKSEVQSYSQIQLETEALENISNQIDNNNEERIIVSDEEYLNILKQDRIELLNKYPDPESRPQNVIDTLNMLDREIKNFEDLSNE
jgi:hypothetical protein